MLVDSADWVDWIAQAEHLLSAARDNAQREWHDVAAVLAQQAAEMSAKGLLIARTGEPPPRIHAVDELLAALNASEALLEKGATLADVYLHQRYPGASAGPPFRLVTCELAQEYLAAAEEIVSWAKGELPE